MKLGKPCRRGRRRSQGCPPTMTLPALANFRSPARSVRQTDRLDHANHGPSVLESGAVPPLMREGMLADHYAARTGESPVSAASCQTDRMDWNTPTTAHLSREVLHWCL